MQVVGLASVSATCFGSYRTRMPSAAAPGGGEGDDWPVYTRRPCVKENAGHRTPRPETLRRASQQRIHHLALRRLAQLRGVLKHAVLALQAVVAVAHLQQGGSE
mmetsp:Transcript_50944/g.166477  ORF Transcript_50944/g.166477 Transcript_50944/m.166477 type:complete len:104 (+) Transcript_50944:461-772(+)